MEILQQDSSEKICPISIQTEDQGCENVRSANNKETKNCEQNMRETAVNLDSIHPLGCENVNSASTKQTKNCEQQNMGKSVASLDSNHPLGCENVSGASTKETKNSEQNMGETVANLVTKHPLAYDNVSASTKETRNCEQNMGKTRTILDSNRSLKVENPNTSSAGAKPTAFEWFKNYFGSFNDTSLQQKTPKRTVAVVTLEDLTKSVQVPTIRLKLKNPAKDNKLVSMFGVQECVDDMLRKAETDLHLVQKPKEEALARNVKHLGAIIDTMEQRICQMAKEFKTQFISLTLEQQEEFLVFWKATEEVLGIVLEWLCQVFYVVLAKIREGYVIEKDVLRRIFKMGAAMLKELYSEPMNMLKE